MIQNKGLTQIDKEGIMPGFNRQGPMGQGALTGGGRGNCRPGVSNTAAEGTIPGFQRGYGQPVGMGYGFGARNGRGRCQGGMGMGRGMAMGNRRFAGMESPTVDPVNTLDFLKAEADALKQSLKDVEQRIADMDQPVK